MQFIIKQDKKNTFKFASLQSNFGQNILQQNQLSQQEFDSFIYLRNNQLLQKSTAALYVFKDLGSWYSLAFAFIIIPAFIRNFVYTTIAKNRYKWFGKKDSCMMPTPELQAKFINN